MALTSAQLSHIRSLQTRIAQKKSHLEAVKKSLASQIESKRAAIKGSRDPAAKTRYKLDVQHLKDKLAKEKTDYQADVAKIKAEIAKTRTK